MIENNKKKNAVSLKEQIELLNNMKKEIEKESLKGKINKTTEEFRLLSKQEITISIGEIIKELSCLTGIDVSDMGIEINTNVGYWGKKNMEQFIEIMNSPDQYLSFTSNYSKNNYLSIKIFADKNLSYLNNNQLFCYQLKRKFDLEEIQSDGKMLLEHCNVQQKYEDFQGLYTTKLVVDKDMEGLNININLCKLIQEDDKTIFGDKWYPTNLIRQAVINSINKKTEKQEHKVKAKKQGYEM